MSSAKLATLGGASFDVFLMGESLRAKIDVHTRDEVEQFPLGAKIELDSVVFSTGGDATNAAATFARQGFDATMLGKIGDDFAGQAVLKALRAEGVNTAHIKVDLTKTTAYSTLLLDPNGEKTVLMYRGASQALEFTDFNFTKVEADWLYISSLGGNFKLLEQVLEVAKTRNIKVSLDAGSKELAQPSKLKRLLPSLTLLKGNLQELKQLSSVGEPAAIVRQLAPCCPYVVLSDGAQGSWVSDGDMLYRAGMYKKVKVVDRTGAGDAFGSGLVASLVHGKTMEEAITFASANATSVVEQIGAKAGILRAGAKIEPMKIETTKL